MKRPSIFFFLFCSVVLFFSCKDDEDGILSLSSNKLDFKAEGESLVLNIVTGHDWYVESAIDWISFVPTSGSGNSAISVVAAMNEEDVDRSSTFYIRAGKLSRSIRVSQKGTYLIADSTSLLFDREGTPKELSITTRYSWVVATSNAEWCEVEPLEGTGDGVLVFTPLPITERYPRHNNKVKISCNGTDYYITISQDVENIAPTAPQLLYPLDEMELEGTYPYFVWEESFDADGDEIFYQIYVTESLSGDSWEKLHSEGITETSYYLDYTHPTDKKLDDNTLYYWKVVAYDNYWGGETESEIFQLTTGTNEIHEDGTVFKEQISAYTDQYEKVPILVILGDGFVETDFAYGGLFDIMANVAIESFFSVEPFPTYRDYFDVYKIVTYSEESGATVSSDFYDYDIKKQTVNTAFKSSFVGGGSMRIDCDDKFVFDYVKDKLELDEEELNNTTVLLMINLNVYAGTTNFLPEGRSVAMCPISRDYFQELVTHEAAGHGFGRLVDEYIVHEELTISEARIKMIEDGRAYEDRGAWWFGANVSLTNDADEVHWGYYLDRRDYNVDFYEGALDYGKGIWRPEEYSCMMDNLPYYNAPSREAIVRRIMYIVGEEFNRDDFVEKDVIKTYTPPVTSFSTGSTQKKRAPLAPPVLIP